MNGNWYYSPDHGQPCQLIESQTFWGERTCRVWLPGSDSVVCVPASRGEYAFAARRRVIERVGLPQVRHHRLNLLQQEESAWNEELKRKAQVYPEMVSLIIIRVEGGHHE